MSVFCVVLESYGFEVLRAISAREALEQFNRHQNEIDLLVADLLLPDGSGLEVALECSSRCARLRIIITSGCPLSEWKDSDRTGFRELYSGRVAFLQKPFPPAALLQAVNSLHVRPQGIDRAGS
jgi:DNA-binding response OmpR family regulator